MKKAPSIVLFLFLIGLALLQALPQPLDAARDGFQRGQVEPNVTATNTPPSSSDPYEPDNTCTAANEISPDGDYQEHNFHTPGDADWLRFDAVAGATYIISALATGDNAHPIIRLYNQCEATSTVDVQSTSGPDQRITFRAQRSGLHYLEFIHIDENTYGNDTVYQVSVRSGIKGAAVIVGGRLYQNDQLQQQITFMTDRAYEIFHQSPHPDYGHDDLYYMSADPDLPSYMDAPSLPSTLRYAIQTWAPEQLNDGETLYIYLADHADNEVFFLDTSAHKITSDDLDTWLLNFEAQRPNSPVVVIIEASRSGSFITPPGTISKPGRIIVTSTGENTDAFVKPPDQGGGYFSDAFFNALAQNYDLWQSYQRARLTVEDRFGDLQIPWIDGNGNGVPYPDDPDDEGTGRNIGVLGPVLTPTPTATNSPTPTTTNTTTPTPSLTRTPTATPSATPTRTNTPTSTATATPSPTPSSTPTSSPTPTPTPTNTPWSGGDPYENDNVCTDANAIPPNGSPQKHNIHTAGDTDWVRFNATAGTYYIISALHVGEASHPILRLYDACDKAPIADPGDPLGFDSIVGFRAEHSGPYYVELKHLDPNAAGHGTDYQISVRPGAIGAAIIAGGRLHQNEQFQQQITFMTDRAYRILHQAGYEHDDIYYMSADPNPPPHMDSPSLPDVLRYAIETWAPQRMQDGDPLYLYLVDHGDNEYFSLNPGQDDKITSAQLDAWLRAFEAQRPHSPVVVIIEACRSGSFITPPGTVSQPRPARAGRIVVTATGDNNDAFAKSPGQGGAYFSDAFFGALAQNYDLWESYRVGQQVVRDKWGDIQTPWIDGNGNGLPYPLDPNDEGAGRGLGLGRVAGLSGQAPFIEQPTVPQPDEGVPVLIQVKVLDEILEGITVWMEVTKPSTPPPSAPPGYITPISHAERAELRYNPDTGLFEAEFTFDEAGRYQFVFNAEDAGGQRAQSVSVTTTAGGAVYLPLLMRP